MTRTSYIFAPILALITLCGCSEKISPKLAKERLIGKYSLGGKACEPFGVKLSTLILRQDGTYDQHIEFLTGEVVDEVGQQWKYDGGVHFSNFRITATGELNRYAPETEASLIVEFSHPTVILLDPSSNCVYTQPK
jgi:hypothetical protein